MILRASRRIDIPPVDPVHFLQNPVQSLKNPGDITHQIMGQSRRERQKKKINKKKKILRGSRDTSRVVMWQSWWISREMYFISDWIHRYRPPVFPPVLVWEKFFFSNFLFLIFFPILFPIFGRFLDDFKNGFGMIFYKFWEAVRGVWEGDLNINQHQTTQEGGLRGHPRHEPLPGRHLIGFGLISGLFFIGFGMNFHKLWEAVRRSILQSRSLHFRSLHVTYCSFFASLGVPLTGKRYASIQTLFKQEIRRYLTCEHSVDAGALVEHKMA